MRALATEGPQQPRRPEGPLPTRTRGVGGALRGEPSSMRTASRDRRPRRRGRPVARLPVEQARGRPREIRLGFQNKGFCKQSVQNKAFLT